MDWRCRPGSVGRRFSGRLASCGEPGCPPGAPVGQPVFAGDIAEILVYDRGLATKERLELEDYLSRKYGIALSR